MTEWMIMTSLVKVRYSNLYIGNMIGQSHGMFCQISDIEKMELSYSFLIVYISTETNYSISFKAML